MLSRGNLAIVKIQIELKLAFIVLFYYVQSAPRNYLYISHSRSYWQMELVCSDILKFQLNINFQLMQVVCTCLAYFDTYMTKSVLEETLVYATEQSLQLLLRGMQLQVYSLDQSSSSKATNSFP